MSNVSNVLLTCSFREGLFENASINHLNQLLNPSYPMFKPLQQEAGGPKHMECWVYGCAFNYLNEDELTQAVENTPWQARDYVQVFIQRQEENTFSLFWP